MVYFLQLFFLTDDIRVLDANPNRKRKFFDYLISSSSSEYIHALQQYQKALKLRSSYLHNAYFNNKKIDPIYLESIDSILAGHGFYIQETRKTFIQGFNIYFQKYVQQISNGDDNFHIQYQPSLKQVENKSHYIEALKSSWEQDYERRHTTKGIHRDIFYFIKKENNIDLQNIASQGQKRTVALAVKMAQFDFTLNKINSKPVLLIDDVLNELDFHRKKHFILFLSEIGQALITTTDVHNMKEFIEQHKKDIQIFQLSLHSQKVECIEII